MTNRTVKIRDTDEHGGGTTKWVGESDLYPNWSYNTTSDTLRIQGSSGMALLIAFTEDGVDIDVVDGTE